MFHDVALKSSLKMITHVARCGDVVDSTLTPVDHLSIFDTVELPSLTQPCSFSVDFKLNFKVDFSLKINIVEHHFKCHDKNVVSL